MFTTLRPVLPSPANPIARATLWQMHDVEIVLVRHGQQIPLDQRSDDQITDPPLTAIGERQIEAVADHLAGEEITAVYASTLERARRTGEAIAARHGLDVTTVHEIREVEVLGRPGPVSDAADVDPIVWSGGGERFVHTGRWDSFPLAESSDDFRRRVGRGIEGIVARHGEGRIVIACHGGVINAYVAEILGIDRDYFFRAMHCSVHRIVARHERRAVWNLNETHHLTGDLRTA